MNCKAAGEVISSRSLSRLRHAVRAVVVVAVALAAHPTEVTAENVTRCGPSASGHALYFQGSNSDAVLGWIPDAISTYEILLTYNGEEPDIITTDVVGTRSSRASGVLWL